ERASTWKEAPGGLPVVFQALIAVTAVLLSMLLGFSKSPLVIGEAPPPVTDTSSRMAAPAVPELKPQLPFVPSPSPRLLFTRKTRRRRPPLPAPPSLSRIALTAAGARVITAVMGATVEP